KVAREKIGDAVDHDVRAGFESMCAVNPGDGVVEFAALDICESRTEEVASGGQNRADGSPDGDLGQIAIGESRLVIASVVELEYVDQGGTQGRRQRRRQSVRCNVGSARMFDGVLRAAAFQIQTGESLRVVTHREHFIFADVPVGFAQVNVLVK